MIQIAKIPYRKTYRYPYLSDSMAMTILVYALVLILPFFLVFSVHSTLPLTQTSISPTLTTRKLTPPLPSLTSTNSQSKHPLRPTSTRASTKCSRPERLLSLTSTMSCNSTTTLG